MPRSYAYGKRRDRWICGSNLGNCSSEGPNPQERKNNDSDQKPSHGKLLGANRIKRKVFYLGGIDPKCGNEDIDISEFCKPVCELLECRLMPSRRFGTLAARIVINEKDAEKFQSLHWPDYCFLREWVFNFHEAEKRPKNADQNVNSDVQTTE